MFELLAKHVDSENATPKQIADWTYYETCFVVNCRFENSRMVTWQNVGTKMPMFMYNVVYTINNNI